MNHIQNAWSVTRNVPTPSFVIARLVTNIFISRASSWMPNQRAAPPVSGNATLVRRPMHPCWNNTPPPLGLPKSPKISSYLPGNTTTTAISVITEANWCAVTFAPKSSISTVIFLLCQPYQLGYGSKYNVVHSLESWECARCSLLSLFVLHIFDNN
jgi:hypothetical protein